MSELIIISLIGIASAVVGSIATIAGKFFMHWLKDRSEAKKEGPAKDLRKKILYHNDRAWSNLKTLMHMIGAD